MENNNIYKTPLSGRYASPEMNRIWSNMVDMPVQK